MRLVALATLCFALTPSLLPAQGSGSLSGLIADPAGASIPGARVTVTEVRTNASRQVTAADTGVWTVTPLSPGEYRIDIEAAGFQKLSQSGVRLQVDERVRVDVTLKVGAITEVVEVTGQGSPVNALGTFLCCRAAIDGMLAEGGGNIINLASVASLIAVERRFAYCVSKGAVLSLTRAIAVDYAANGIRANAICPGTVDTPMIRGYVDKYFGHDVPGTIASLHARQPVGRMGDAGEIAALAVFLAGDSSRYLTGAAIPIDGGWTAK